MDRIVRDASRAMALAGGAVLTALVLLTCASIAGREAAALLAGPLSGWAGSAFLLDTVGIGGVPGDFELVEMGMAFCVFAFLPWAQVTRAHAAVDLFVERLPAAAQRALAVATEAVFAAVLVLIAVQLWSGFLGRLSSGQTTLLLQWPVWWGYAAALVPAVLAALVACYMAALRLAGREMAEPAP
jgi:TRAP-type C4-dicarboxylate transport system permease small subunit